MQPVELSTSDWSASAFLARGFLDRLLGRRRAPAGSAVVIPAWTVHSFWEANSIEIIGLDTGMRVVAVRTLDPNRIAFVPSASMIVELPAGSRLPRMADRVEITDG